jgi:hypothetical protein
MNSSQIYTYKQWRRVLKYLVEQKIFKKVIIHKYQPQWPTR